MPYPPLECSGCRTKDTISRSTLGSILAALAVLCLSSRGVQPVRGFAAMSALLSGRSRLRKNAKATFAVSEDEDSDDFDALFGKLAIDATPAATPRGRRSKRVEEGEDMKRAAAAARTPASARKGGLDGDAWARLESLADSPDVASEREEEEEEEGDDDDDSWLASEDDVEAAGSPGSSFVASEDGEDDESVLDLTAETPPKATPKQGVLVDLTNDTPSPRAGKAKREKKAKKATKARAHRLPEASPEASSPPDLSVATPRAVARSFARRRGALLEATFAAYDGAVVDGRLAASVECVWSKRLRTTSGLTRMKQTRASATAPWEKRAVVELSTHVIDSEDKLKNTLAHELCHAAAWVVDGASKPPHGAPFKTWARRFMKAFPDLAITTRHKYVIAYKYNWRCTADGCDFKTGRHSDSLDTTRYCCGKCAAPLEAFVPASA